MRLIVTTGAVVILTGLAAPCLAQSPDPLYKSPIPDSMNIRFVENHITIERPAKSVYDWVTTWGNLPKWLPVAKGASVVKGGSVDQPSQLGDVLLEIVPGKIVAAENSSDGTPPDGFVQYTVVTRIDGFTWTVAGGRVENGKPNDKIQFVATFSVRPLAGGNSEFSRVFQWVRPDISNPLPRAPVEDPQLIQRGLVTLKKISESEIPKG